MQNGLKANLLARYRGRTAAVCCLAAHLVFALDAADSVAVAARPAGASAQAEMEAPDQGQRLAEDLRSRRPGESVLWDGTLENRVGQGARRSVPIRFAIRLNPGREEWEAYYEVRVPEGLATETLTVIHRPGMPNVYRRTKTPGQQAGLAGEEMVLAEREKATVRFADSDFSAADVGLDFLHWPSQKLLKVRNSMRKGRACKVLESALDAGATPPDGCVRVRAWIDVESGGPIYAEAYARDGRRLKVFEVDRVSKVNGVWQVTEIEMRDERTDSRTSIRFRTGP